jgi:hypothetical protein
MQNLLGGEAGPSEQFCCKTGRGGVLQETSAGYSDIKIYTL